MAQSTTTTKRQRHRVSVKVQMTYGRADDERVLGVVGELKRFRKFTELFREAMMIIWSLNARKYAPGEQATVDWETWLIKHLDKYYGWLVRRIENRAIRRWEQQKQSGELNQLWRKVEALQEQLEARPVALPAPAPRGESKPKSDKPLVTIEKGGGKSTAESSANNFIKNAGAAFFD